VTAPALLPKSSLTAFSKRVSLMSRDSLKLSLLTLLLGFYSTLAFAQNSLPDLVAAAETDEALAMIEAGADVNEEQSDGTTALLYAIHYGHKDLVMALLEAGADATHANDYGAGTMSEAAQLGDVEILQALLDHGADANWQNPEGETALMIAARSGNVPYAEILIEHGADINARENWGSQSALMWAAAQEQPEMLRLLIQHGAELNQQSAVRLWERRILSEPRPKDMNKGGFYPLHYAARQGCSECIEILAEAGADLDVVDPDRVSPLNLALINMNFEAAAALIEAGADVNSWDLFGRSPLYNAIDMNTIPVGSHRDIPSGEAIDGYDVAVLLLERGANPNMQLKLRPPYRNAIYDRGVDNPLSYGATPLLRAARAADIEAVRLLLEHGALANLPNGKGQTPLLVVSGIDWSPAPTRGRYKTEADSIETIRLLLEAGADINAITGDPTLPPIAEEYELSVTDIIDPNLIRYRPEEDQGNFTRASGLHPAQRGGVEVDGQTALHAAARMGWNQIIQFLIDNGIRQQVMDDNGNTPLDLAMGRYAPDYNAAPASPLWDTVQLLQESCQADDNCVLLEPEEIPAQ